MNDVIRKEDIEDLAELIRDAKRWRYIRDNHARSDGLHMDGTASWRFSPLRWCVGRTITEVVDKLINKEYE